MIRLARPTDLPRYAIIERAAATLYAPWGLDDAFSVAATPSTRVERAIAAGELIVATDENDVMIGYALVAADPDGVHLEELAVEPAHGRRGHGTALVRATIAMAAHTKAERVTLITLDFVPFGKAFYERSGFHEIARDALPLHLRELLPIGEQDGRIAMARAV
jgi:N-acetylglutamate synthase-like GNAT family acetyltransferase